MTMNYAALLYKAMTASERKKADAYAGPDESFPLYANGDHLAAAWDLAGHAANPDAVRAKIRAFAEKHGLTHLLPKTAMTKGVTIAQSFALMKSWSAPDSEDVQIEGWMSTPDKDLENMVIEPEAFLGSIDEYFLRRAPLSFNHNGKSLPAGHLQKAAIIRDGQVLKTAQHPSDTADFEDLPTSGSGVWVRGVINDPLAGSAVRKGNVGAFSWIGHGREYEPLLGGGKRFTIVEPLMESTVAPYPVNTKAVIKIAKAFGLEDTQEEPMNEDILKLLAEMNAKLSAPAETIQKGVSEEEMATALAKQAEEFKAILAGAVETAVKETEDKLTKAFEAQRVGQGRSGTVVTEADEREGDPLAYVLKKSRDENGLDDPMDRDLAWKLTQRALVDGLRDA